MPKSQIGTGPNNRSARASGQYLVGLSATSRTPYRAPSSHASRQQPAPRLLRIEFPIMGVFLAKILNPDRNLVKILSLRGNLRRAENTFRECSGKGGGGTAAIRRS